MPRSLQVHKNYIDFDGTEDGITDELVVAGVLTRLSLSWLFIHPTCDSTPDTLLLSY